MKIKCFRECYINKKKITPGTKKHDDIDHKDFVTAMQLRVLKKGKAIHFDEKLPEPIKEIDGYGMKLEDAEKQRKEEAEARAAALEKVKAARDKAKAEEEKEDEGSPEGAEAADAKASPSIRTTGHQP
jgi:hypothetical protein